MTGYRGVIEGFYGKPWGWQQRDELIQIMKELGLNCYMYAPKFDLNHRLKWQEPYPEKTLESFQTLCETGDRNQVKVILSLSPGLSIKESDTKRLIERFNDLADTGATSLALLMDDIPYSNADPRMQSSMAQALSESLPDVDWFFCPTAYSRWHLNTWPEATDYLKTIGDTLPESWKIFWTGETVISRTITSSHLLDIAEILGRKPVIWDNYSADDYVPAGSFFPGPFTGRDGAIQSGTNGLLLNPSDLFPSSLLNIHTMASWFSNPDTYEPIQAFSEAVTWLGTHYGNQSEQVTDSLVPNALIELLGYFYTPFEIHPHWKTRLEAFANFIRVGTTVSNPESEFVSIRDILRDEQNFQNYRSLWIELYPFVRSLLGDLDYLIAACRKRASGESVATSLPPRESRWSSPLNDLLVTFQ